MAGPADLENAGGGGTTVQRVDTAQADRVQHHSVPPVVPMPSVSTVGERPSLLQHPSTVTVGGFDYGPSPRTEYKVVQREQVANPAPLGLLAFGYTTALLQGANTAITDKSAAQLAAAFGLFFGGLAQFLAGMWEFKRQNTFGAAAFTSYGSFWMGFALLQILVAAGLFKVGHNADQMMLSLWGILTFIFMIATLELNFSLWLLFFTLSILFWVLAAGVEALFWTRFAGWWGLFVAGVAWYIAAADIINEQFARTVLPVGKWSVGVPMARALKRMMAKIPVIGWAYVRAVNREDKLAGLGKFAAKDEEAQAGAPAGPSGVMHYSHLPFVLHSAGEPGPGGAWEGAAVSAEQRYAPQGSAIGPY